MVRVVLAALANNSCITSALNTLLVLRNNISFNWRIELYNDGYPAYSISQNLYQGTRSTQLILNFIINNSAQSYYPPSEDLEHIDKNIGTIIGHLDGYFIARHYSPSIESTNCSVSYVVGVGEHKEFLCKLEKAARNMSDSIFTQELEGLLSED